MKRKRSAIDGFKEWEKNLMRESKRSFYNAPILEQLLYLFVAAACLILTILLIFLIAA